MKRLSKYILGLIVSAGILVSPVALAVVTIGINGGTGIATSTAGHDGDCLKQTSSTPFLTYLIQSCGSGTVGPSTSTYVTYFSASGTVTGNANFTFNATSGVLSAPTGTFSGPLTASTITASANLITTNQLKAAGTSLTLSSGADSIILNSGASTLTFPAGYTVTLGAAGSVVQLTNGATFKSGILNCNSTSSLQTTSDGTVNCQAMASGGSSSSTRAATKIVCASDALDTTNCDYLTDGTADDVQVQSAINALPSGGGKVLLSEGTFNFSVAAVVSSSNVTIEGMGWSTVVKAKVNFNSYLFKVQDNGNTLRKNLTFINFKIDGDKLDQSSGGCMDASSTAASVFYRIWFTACKDYALILGGTASGTFGFNNTVVNSRFDNGGSYGIYMTSNDENIISNNIFSDLSIYHIFDNSGSMTITGNTFVGGLNATSGIAVYVSNTSASNISNNFFDGVYQQAVYIDGSTDNKISSNIITRVSNSVTSTSAIYTNNGTGNTINDNTVKGAPFFKYAYEEAGTSADNQIGINRFEKGASGTILLSGISPIWFTSPSSTIPGATYFAGIQSLTGNFALNAPSTKAFTFNVSGTVAGTVSSTGYYGPAFTAAGLPYITTSTGLTVANFATTSISQWVNDSGYLRNSSITATSPITWSASNVIAFTNPGYVTAASSVTWSAQQTFSLAPVDAGGNKFVTSTTAGSSTVQLPNIIVSTQAGATYSSSSLVAAVAGSCNRGTYPTGALIYLPDVSYTVTSTLRLCSGTTIAGNPYGTTINLNASSTGTGNTPGSRMFMASGTVNNIGLKDLILVNTSGTYGGTALDWSNMGTSHFQNVQTDGWRYSRYANDTVNNTFYNKFEDWQSYDKNDIYASSTNAINKNTFINDRCGANDDQAATNAAPVYCVYMNQAQANVWISPDWEPKVVTGAFSTGTIAFRLESASSSNLSYSNSVNGAYIEANATSAVIGASVVGTSIFGSQECCHGFTTLSDSGTDTSVINLTQDFGGQLTKFGGSGITVSGVSSLAGVTFTNATGTGNLQIATLKVTGAVNISSTLTVQGNATIRGDLLDIAGTKYQTSSLISLNGYSSSSFTLAGTANQITATHSPSGTITFSLNGADGGGNWKNSIIQTSGANVIVQVPTSTAFLGNLIQSGGVQLYTTSTAISGAQFCGGGLIMVASTTATTTLTLPTMVQLASSTFNPNCYATLWASSFAQQFIVNSSTFNVVANTSGTGEIQTYSPGTPNVLAPGQTWFVQGLFINSSTVVGATSTGMILQVNYTLYQTSTPLTVNGNAITITGNVSGTTANFSSGFSLGALLADGSVKWDPTLKAFGVYDTGNSLYYGISDALPSPAGWSTLGGYFAGMGIGCTSTSTWCFGVLANGQSSAGVGNTAFAVNGTNEVDSFNNVLDSGGSVGNMVIKGIISAGVASIGAPEYTFTGDLDTGIYHPSANQIGFSVNGIERMRLTDILTASATTTVLLLNPSSTLFQISGGHASGTLIGTNPLTYNGDFINFQVASSTKFKVASSGATTIGDTTTTFQIFGNGHINATGTTPTVSSCGTSPSIVGNDASGKVQVGSIAATGCTITFASAYVNTPNCLVSEETGSVANTFNYALTSTTIVVTQTGLTNDILHYYCNALE